MSLYVIAKDNTSGETLDTPVFEVGADSSNSAVAVFLSAESAAQYIQDAGWKDDQAVAQLEPTQALKWLVMVHEDDISHIAVDPNDTSNGGSATGPR